MRPARPARASRSPSSTAASTPASPNLPAGSIRRRRDVAGDPRRRRFGWPRHGGDGRRGRRQERRAGHGRRLRRDHHFACGRRSGQLRHRRRLLLLRERHRRRASTPRELPARGSSTCRSAARPPGSTLLAAMNARSTGAGIILVISAGNEGDKPEGINPDPFALVPAQQFPNNVIIAGSVGVSDGAGGTNLNQISTFSNRAGTGAPNYLTALGYRNRTIDHTGALFLFSGTSFSAPMITGAVALLAHAFPNLTASQILSLLFTTADDLGAVGTDFDLRPRPAQHHPRLPAAGHGLARRQRHPRRGSHGRRPAAGRRRRRPHPRQARRHHPRRLFARLRAWTCRSPCAAPRQACRCTGRWTAAVPCAARQCPPDR